MKKFGGERVIPGNIIMRQRGRKFHPGANVGIGRDHTLYALTEGWVKFEYVPMKYGTRTFITVVDHNPNPPKNVVKNSP